MPDYGSYLLRLTDLERSKLQLIVAALKVSEYTDDVDNFMRPYDKEHRMLVAMRELFDTIVGLAVASDAITRSVRESLLAGGTDLTAVVPLLEELFEILRRHKRLNPFDHRGEYGKMMMLLQDVQKSSIQRALEIRSTLVIPVRTVGEALTSVQCEALLQDEDIRRTYLKLTGVAKQQGLEALVCKYSNGDRAKADVIEHCLRSIDDVTAFLQANRAPLQHLRRRVQRDFEPLQDGEDFNISIRQGHHGACFTHRHHTHCQYVVESLLLWENVQKRIFELWAAAEDDMLVDGRGQYNFVNTGQGFHRMCAAPKSYRIMSHCVQETEQAMGGWVGIKVIHLGDRDVPNPLVFIDKYTIIPRIVQPMVHTLSALKAIFHVSEADEDGAGHGGATMMDEYDRYPGLKNLFRTKFRSYEDLRMLILCDFFKYAFDGSGDDGGSCIDGRLTSAWNWCHQLQKKTYYDAFVLTGFNGFD